MNRISSLRLIGATALALALSSPAFADDTTGSTDTTTGSAADFGSVDTNGDGYIDSMELESSSGMTGDISIHDSDGDGMLSEDEYMGYQSGASGGMEADSGETYDDGTGTSLDSGTSLESDTGLDTGSESTTTIE